MKPLRCPAQQASGFAHVSNWVRAYIAVTGHAQVVELFAEHGHVGQAAGLALRRGPSPFGLTARREACRRSEVPLRTSARLAGPTVELAGCTRPGARTR